MSGKFNNRGNKRIQNKFLWVICVAVILFGVGSLYFLQPKPPASEEIRQEVSLPLGNDTPPSPQAPAPPSSASSLLPSLPAPESNPPQK